MSFTTSRPAGTTTPWKSAGTARPSSVENDRSAMASSGNGLYRASSRVASLAVAPSAKYHRVDADDAHGELAVPAGPVIVCSTTALPLPRSTKAAACSAGVTSARRTVVLPDAFTSIGTVVGSPCSGTTVTVPFTGASSGLATTTAAAYGLSPRPAPPAQYQVDDSAEAGGAVGISARPTVPRTGTSGRS